MVGILYESDEWSDWKLRDELERELGEPVAMICMEDEDSASRAAACDFLVSRVFASAVFRGHIKSEEHMRDIIQMAARRGIRMINPARAHAFEVSKALSTRTLDDAGIPVPRVLDLGRPQELASRAQGWPWPSIVKPDRGGRTTHTSVLRSPEDAARFLEGAPDIDFIVEEFLEAAGGFLTRVEVVDGGVALVVKRSVAANGLSSYHEGSTYEMYADCPQGVLDVVARAARELDIWFGSFDVIEAKDGRAYVIDANSVSNVSEDCTELFEGFDLMRTYAVAMARRIRAGRTREEKKCTTSRMCSRSSAR